MSEHHATVYIAASIETSTLPEAYRTPSADVSHVVVDRLSINDVRELSFAIQQRPVAATHRVFVIVATVLPTETQNALLKIFEEPPAATKLCLVIPNGGILLPTLRSRVVIEAGSGPSTTTPSESFTAFMRASYPERLAQIAQYAKNKEVLPMRAVAAGALQYAQQHLDDPTLGRVALLVGAQLDGPGAAKKMLLEWLALTLPAETEV